MSELTIATYGGADVRPLLDDLTQLYLEVYAEPPYGEGPDELPRFVESFLYQAEAKGFRLVTAREGDALVGFTFGFILGSGSHWWDDAVVPLPTKLTSETGDRTFAIIELLVKANRRHHGIGRQLHDTLTTDLPTERITLLVRPEAAPARRAYESWGYEQVGQMQPAHGPIGSAEEQPTYLALIRTKERVLP